MLQLHWPIYRPPIYIYIYIYIYICSMITSPGNISVLMTHVFITIVIWYIYPIAHYSGLIYSLLVMFKRGRYCCEFIE